MSHTIESLRDAEVVARAFEAGPCGSGPLGFWAHPENDSGLLEEDPWQR